MSLNYYPFMLARIAQGGLALNKTTNLMAPAS